MNATTALSPTTFIARDSCDIVALALRGVLTRFNIHGLGAAEFNTLRATYFAHAPEHIREAEVDSTAARTDEIDDVLRLLLDHRSDDSQETRWVAHAIATACLGNNHLYQDMGLESRATLSDLLRERFSALFAKNVGNMKWKKFFYKQLCERAEINICKAPSCKVCDDYMKCFGPE